jgi:hypothetical protein
MQQVGAINSRKIEQFSLGTSVANADGGADLFLEVKDI